MAPPSAPGSTIAPVRPSRPARRGRGARVDGTCDLPPVDGDGEGGGGGGGSGEEGDERWSRARFALLLVLFGIGTLFAAFLLAYAVLRRNAPVWPPPGAPVPPKGLWIPTLVLIASSASLVRARGPGRARGRERARWLACTLVLGILFLLAQAFLWRDVLVAGRSAASDAYGTIFYSLTGLHAAHVVAGLVLLARAVRRARREPTAPRTGRLVGLSAIYWHFMGALWLVLFAVLYSWS